MPLRLGRDCVRSWWRAANGTAAIEFGLFAPLLLLLLVGSIEVGNGVFEGMQVQAAAEAGGMYAAAHGWDIAGISAAVENATQTSGIAATPAPSEFCGCATVSGVAAVNCTLTCVGGSAPGTYARINATLAHNTILTLPGLALPANLTGLAIVRLD